MASAFWTLEDGRGLAKQWSFMAYALELITNELREIKGAEDFYQYLEAFVYRQENGDQPNGYGGFIKGGVLIKGDENIMFNFDLRSFAPRNRVYFWQATQAALTKIKIQNDKNNEGIEGLLTILLDMHKRIKRAEDPMLLNDMRIVDPEPTEKLGPGW